MHGCAIWTFSAAHRWRFDASELRLLRRMAGAHPTEMWRQFYYRRQQLTMHFFSRHIVIVLGGARLSRLAWTRRPAPRLGCRRRPQLARRLVVVVCPTQERTLDTRHADLGRHTVRHWGRLPETQVADCFGGGPTPIGGSDLRIGASWCRTPSSGVEPLGDGDHGATRGVGQAASESRSAILVTPRRG